MGGRMLEYVDKVPVEKLVAKLSAQLKNLHKKSENTTKESWKKVISCKNKPKKKVIGAAKKSFTTVKKGYKDCQWKEETLELNVVRCKVELEAHESMISAAKKNEKVKGKMMVDKKVCNAATG